MEDGWDRFEKQVIGMSKTKVGKPPTRLQKLAPASLQLDQMKADSARASGAATPIPLLTPLALSPNPFTETEEFVFPTDDKKIATPAPIPTAFDWKNPAGTGYVEASTLFTLFQTKCVLVNDVNDAR